MDKSLMERRIVKAGIALSRDRVERGGQPIRSEDLMRMKVKTFSPATQIAYVAVGALLFVVGLWVYFQTRTMVMAMVTVLLGIANIGYGIQGRPRAVADLGLDLDMTRLASEIVAEFVRQMDARQGPAK